MRALTGGPASKGLGFAPQAAGCSRMPSRGHADPSAADTGDLPADATAGHRMAPPLSGYAIALHRHRHASPGRQRRVPGTFGDRRSFVVAAWRDMLGRTDLGAYHRHQVDAMRAIVDRVGTEANDPGALTVIPAAGGKTRIFLALIDALRAYGLSSGTMPNVIVLLPTRTLIRQTLEGFARHFPLVDVGAVASGMGSRIRPVTLMTYAGFASLARRGGIRPGDVDCLVMDEAHRGLSDLRRPAIEAFRGRAVITAFSATPSFDPAKRVQDLLGPASEVFNVTSRTLRDRDVIAPVVNYVLGIALEGEAPADPVLRALAKRKAVVDAALDFIESHVDGDTALAGKVAIFYGADRAHARMFAAEYNRRLGPGGKRMVVLTGEDPTDRAGEVADLVRAGKVTAIGNANLLQEGWDLPEVGLVVNSPTSSLVRQLQQSGRAQRLDRNLGPEAPRQTAYVIDLYLRVNGRIQGVPRFFFEASGEVGTGRLVDMPAIDFADVGLDGFMRDEFLPEVDCAEIDRDGSPGPGAGLGDATGGIAAGAPAVGEPPGREPSVAFRPRSRERAVVPGSG